MALRSSPEKTAEARARYETERVSERLRELRLGRKLTISRLAELSKVPASTISKIENGQLRPSLVHAINLASALQENLGFLVARFRERPQPRAVVRRAERHTIEYPEMGLTLQDLSGHFLPGVLEARLGILTRGAHSGVGSMTHQGEEFCFVLSGAISYRIDQETYDLGCRRISALPLGHSAFLGKCRGRRDQGLVDILRRAFILIEDTMHKVTVRQEIIDRVLARRGRYHWFDELDPRRTALVVIDMQELFCAPGAPAEVPGSREIVEPINALTDELRNIGVPVIWVLHANTQSSGRSDWELFFNYIVADEVREKTRQSLAPGRQKVWSGLTVGPADTTIIKNRYSALIAGSSGLERLLRSLDIDTVLIAGTKTNICCEATARDAMMLDFKVVMVSDCCAALSDDEHRAALENIIQQFGDVMTGAEVLERLRRQSNR